MKASDVLETSGPKAHTRERGRPARLFADLFSRRASAELDLPTAMMIPIVGAMLADGRVDEEELFQIDAICAFSPIFERNSSYENELLIIRSTRLIEDYGLQKMCERAAALLSAELRETTFVYAVKVVLSDGEYGQLEREVIVNIRDWLGVTPERAEMMVEVIGVMRRSAAA